MNYKKRKGLLEITVKAWDKTVTLTNIATKRIVASETFSDHIQAVLAFKAL